MPSVGTAYVNVRINTKGFNSQLESMMAGLSKKMEKAGNQLGKDLEKGLKDAKPFDQFLKDSEKAANDFGKHTDKINDSWDRSMVNISDGAKVASQGFKEVEAGAKGARGEVGQLGQDASRAKRSMSGLGSGSGGLRKAANDVGFFSSALKKMDSQAKSDIKLLQHLHNVEAFMGTGLAGAVGTISALGQGIFAIGSNAAAAAPALAVFANGIMGLAQVGGVASLAMKAIGPALTAGLKTVAPAANAAAGATKGLGDAAAAAARQVRDAKQGLQNAYQDAARSASDAARRVKDAEATLAQATMATAAAQKELNAALAAGQEEMKQIGFSAEQASIDQDNAALALADAQDAAAAASDLAKDDPVRIKALLDLHQAELNYREAKDATSQSDKAQQKVAKEGVHGTDAYTTALNNFNQAQKDQNSAAKDVQDARRDQVRTAQDNARAIAKAQQTLADAQAALTKAQNKGTDATSKAATAMDAYQAQLNALGPDQKEFVKRLIKMHKGFVDFRTEVTAPMFKRFNDALDYLNTQSGKATTIQGVLKEGLKGTAKEMGDGANKAAHLAAQPVFQKSLGDAMKANNKVINHGTGIIVDLVDAFVSLADAAGPTAVKFSAWLETVTEHWADVAKLNNQTGHLSYVIQEAGDRVTDFWGLAKELWKTLRILGNAANIAANNFGKLDKKGKPKGYIPTLTEDLHKFNQGLKDNPDLIKNFTQTLHTLNAAGRVLKTVTQPLVDLGHDKKVEDALDKISKSHAFERIGKSAGNSLPIMADMVVNILDFVAALSESHGIENFLKIMRQVTKIVAAFVGWLADHGILRWIGYITAATAAMSILSKAARITASPFIRLANGYQSFKKMLSSTYTSLGNIVKRMGAFKQGFKGSEGGFFSKVKGGFAGSKAEKESQAAARATTTTAAGGAAGEGTWEGKVLTVLSEINGSIKLVQEAVNTCCTRMVEAMGTSKTTGAAGAAGAADAAEGAVEGDVKMTVPDAEAQGQTVGAQFMGGIKLGITEGITALEAAATEAGNAMIQAMKTALGEASLSKRGIEMGAWLDEGLVEGMTGGQAGVDAAAAEVGNSAATSMGAGAKAGAAEAEIAGGLGGGAALGGIGGAAEGEIGKVGKFSGILGKFGKMAGPLTKMMKPLSFGIKAVGGALKFAMGPWGMLIMILLPILLPLLIKLDKKFHIVQKTMDAVGWAVKKMGDFFTWVWKKAIVPLFDWVKKNWPLLLGIITGPIGLAVVLITKNWDTIWKIVSGTVHKVINILKGMWHGIVTGWTVVQNFIKGLWPKHIKPIITGLLNILKKHWMLFFFPIISAWIVIGRFLLRLWKDKVWPRISDLLSKAHDKLTGFWDGIMDAWHGFMHWLSGRWPAMERVISSLVSNVSDAVKGIFNGMGEGIIAAENFVFGKLQWLIDKLNAILGIFGVSAIKVNLPTDRVFTGYRFAEGGPVRGPGGSKTDSIPARLSNGEHVMTAAEVRAFGGHKNVTAMREAALRGEAPGKGGLFSHALSLASGIIPGAALVFDTVKDALKKGGEIALRWALAEFKKLVGGGNVIKDMAVGAFEWASEKMFAFGRDQDQAAAAAAAAAASSTGSGPAAVWRALRSVGFSKVQTAGIMGSMQSESHFDPTIVQGGGHSMNPAAAGSMGYGLVQWTPGAKLIPYLGGKAPSINTEISALAAQLAGHGSSPEGAAGKALRSATTVVEAARAFELGYERHAGPPQASRITQAMAWYKKFKGSDAMEAAGAAPYTGAPGGWAYPIPKTNVTYNWDGHSPASALDMHAVEGTPVHALSSGNISFAIAPGRSYGNYLTIAHAGDWQSRYAHLQRAVRKSGRVRAGELIAFSGHTGGVPAHLHLELAKHVGIKNYPDTHTELVRRGLRYPYSPTGSRGPFHFALGGVAQATPGGVLSLLAEAGKSERVTPLDNQGFTPAERAMLERLEATLGGGGNGDTYHVHPTPGMDETALADKVSRRVAWNRRRGVRRP